MGTIATTVFAQSLSNFKCTFARMRGGTLLILGHGVKCQSKLWPPCEGMPRLALSSFSYFRVHHIDLRKVSALFASLHPYPY